MSENARTSTKRVQPSVVIGLGGTGVKAITLLKKTLEEQAGDIRELVRFLAVDIDEITGEVPSSKLFGSPIRLDKEQHEFLRIVDQTGADEAKNIPEVNNWFPPEGYKYLPLTEGARQCKPVGRLGFFLHHFDIAERIFKLVDGLTTAENLKRFPSLSLGELNIYIVGSICGGTGAGLFLDMAYELRYLKQQAHLPDKTRIKGLFALGDVYNAISKRVLANTFASLLEINWFQRDGANYTPIYPDATRETIHSRAFDSIYLVGNNSTSDISLAEPEEFAQLCADMIFLDSGSDALESGGKSLSSIIQSARNNSEVYTMNNEADGTPRCYSSFGLCKIRFPWERVVELCGARLSAELMSDFVVGETSQHMMLEARQKAQDLILSEGLSCEDEKNDLADRFVERLTDAGERVPMANWITQSLHKAFQNDLENIASLQIGQIKQIVDRLNKDLKQLQEEMDERVLRELAHLHGLLGRTVREQFEANRGVAFVNRLLADLNDSAGNSQAYVQQELKNYIAHEKRLADAMANEVRELADLLDSGLLSFLRREAQRAQLRETYKAIRQHFINRLNIIRMRAAVAYYDGVHDDRQQLVEGGEGAISRLRTRLNSIGAIETACAAIGQEFERAYLDHREIKASAFEILIYDNEAFSDLEQTYDAVVNESVKRGLFINVLEAVGGSVWSVNDYLSDQRGRETLRDLILGVCRAPFEAEVDKKSVAQRIQEARSSSLNAIDYRSRLENAFDLAAYFCRLNPGASRFADLREGEQAMAVVVGYHDEDDTAWEEVKDAVTEGMRRRSKDVPFTRSSDKHNILVYRELSGFPAYTLSRIKAYQTNYSDESKREDVPPLLMFSRENLGAIEVPTRPVLSKFQVLSVEALAYGVITSDEEAYYLLTADEWRRRRLASEAHTRGEDADYEDRTAGSQRRLDSSFNNLVSKMNQRLPDEVQISADRTKYFQEVEYQVRELREVMDRRVACKLLEAMYFEGYEGVESETIDRDTQIKPSVAFLLKRDFALNEKDIRRPETAHDTMLREFYLSHE